MKPLCIVDTNSLIYLSEITIRNRSLHRWLWGEFQVAYSRTVWDEIGRHFEKMGQDAKAIKRDGEQYVWSLPATATYERALFGQPIEREVEAGRRCRICGQPILRKQFFEPDLGVEKDRGERHNCCVALDAVMEGRYCQVIFLTDDYRAVRDYADPVFQTFPLGSIWSSYDFVLYLFVRHRPRIPQNEVEAALRDVTARVAGSGFADHTQQAQQQWVQRLGTYNRKVKKIGQVLSQIQGGP
ncbi:MAG: hypothetical protein H8D43_00560 [Chloroflexi bacterium]|nr:hypothetical protein [Chloroflexota bacterium]